ncbi:unnamed protein product [Protopolystoma xenopodis]|uniref:Helicase C-terminal domain-containing protein n=1 Tax=Protopolystoma xenopodis TaxID=117903 RepID=A0A3S5AEB7_9PLAT|nr:unnamed protein product [Protopolystoma xenopodis]
MTNQPHSHRKFRVLALSASPATDLQGLQIIIANLLISHLEIRNESSSDIQKYVQKRNLETIIVPLGPNLLKVRDQLSELINMPLKRLNQRGAIWRNSGYASKPEHLSKFSLIKARQSWLQMNSTKQFPSSDFSIIQRDFALAISLLHALDLLIQHGLRPLYHFLYENLSGTRHGSNHMLELRKLPQFTKIWTFLSDHFSSSIDEVYKLKAISDTGAQLMNSQTSFIPGHPKLDTLKSLLIEHFTGTRQTGIYCPNIMDTRAIVFTQYRDSVDEIMHMLKQLRPLIRPASFIGQSAPSSFLASPGFHDVRAEIIADATNENLQADCPDKFASSTCNAPPSPTLTGNIFGASRMGKSQRDQMRVLSAFRTGIFNTLVSTCIGEEGIDVGQVDLIVCFDAHKSPIRLVQRLGRTGRQRVGRIVILLTEGKEEANHAISVARISSGILDTSASNLAFYPQNPRMVPIEFTPKVEMVSFNINPILLQDSDLKDLDGECTNQKLLSERIRKPKLSAAFVKQDKFCDLVQSHIEAIGFNWLKLHMYPLEYSELVLTNKHNSTSSFIYNYPNVIKSRCFSACRERLSSKPSLSSIHFVSCLRLSELHRKGATQLSFHAMGYRNVDTETPFSVLLEEYSALSQSSTQRSEPPLKPIISHMSPLYEARNFPTDVILPAVFTGIVSTELIFIPKIPSVPGISANLKALQLYLVDSSAKINLDISRSEQAYDSLLTSLLTSTDSLTTTNLDSYNFNHSSRFNPQTLDYAFDSKVALSESSPNTHCPSVLKSLTSSFGFPIPLRFEGPVNSTPTRGWKDTSPIRPTGNLSSTMQLSFTQALSLLDQSSMHLLTDDLNLPSPSKKITIHEGFSKCLISNFNRSADIDAKLKLDFCFDDNPHSSVLSELKNCDLDADIERQPISSEGSFANISNIFAENNEISSKKTSKGTLKLVVDPHEVNSPVLSSALPSQDNSTPTNTISPLADKRCQHKKRLLLTPDLMNANHEVSGNAVNFGTRKRLRFLDLIFSQADATGSDSDEGSKVSLGDNYDSSFIDDRDSDDLSAEGSSPVLDRSSMHAVFLQSLNSPKKSHPYSKG